MKKGKVIVNNDTLLSEKQACVILNVSSKVLLSEKEARKRLRVSQKVLQEYVAIKIISFETVKQKNYYLRSQIETLSFLLRNYATYENNRL